MSKTVDFKELSDRIRGIAKRASDSEAIKGIKDPAEKGEVTPPNHPDGDSNDKKSLPEQTSTNTSREGQDMTDKDTKPSGTGKNVPPVEQNGNAKEDAATAPDTPLSKIAQTVERIKKLQKSEPVKAASETEPNTEDRNKAAGQSDDVLQGMDLDSIAMHVKLASTLLQTEEGIEAVEAVLRKQAGAQAAAQLIKEAGEQEWLWAQAAAQEEELYNQAAEAEAQWEEFTKTASEEEVAQIVKLAKIHEHAQSGFEYDFEKQAYDMGAQDAAAMEEAMMAEGGEQEIPEEGEISEEEILMLLDEAVQSGELDEETAVALAQELMGGEGGEQPVPEEVMEAEKMASAILA
jgi:hypothetical protein